MADGSVEIRVTGSLDPSVTASANEAKAAIAGIGDATTVSAKAMAAALAATGGNIKKITPDMLGLAAATTASTVATGEQTAATVVNTVATEANTHAAVNSRSVYEGLALVHEAMAGRYTRMASTSLIFGQALAGQSAVTSAVAFATSGLGIAILGTTAVIGGAIVATVQYEAAQEKLRAVSVGLAAQSGLTAEQLNEAGHAAANWGNQSVSQSTKAAEAFASAGIKSENTITQLSRAVGVYAQLTGVKFADAQKSLATAMQDPIKAAEDLHQQLGILDGAQLEQIRQLVELGQREQAAAIITEALTQRTDQARDAGIGAAGAWGTMTNALSNLWGWIGKVNDKLLDQVDILGNLRAAARNAANETAHAIQNQAQLNEISGRGAAVFASTPEGQAAAKRAELQGNLSAARDALKVDTALHGANSEAVRRDREAIADYTHATSTYVTEVQKKTKADAIDVQIAAAKHAHNKQLVADLTEQKALLEESGKIESDADARALAKGKGDVAGARTFAPKGGKGPSIVSEWTEQLHAAEVASSDFFSDQTEKELEFWQGKVGLTKAGSKEWLSVQEKIYQAQKTLAHQDYDEHIADLNDRIEADHDDYKKFQADWAEKLTFIKSKHGEESTEYKDAHRQLEAEERQHQDQMIREELSGNSKAIEALKQHLAAMRQVRQTEASAAEAIVKDQADGAVLGEITAAARIGQIHLQLAQQEIADAEATFVKEDALRQQGLADMVAAGKAETEAYKNAKKAEIDAEQAFQDRKRALEAQAYAQQIQDILAVKAAYSSYISGTVGATISGLDGMLSRTKTWQQAAIGVYQSLVSTFENALGKMVTKWVVEHVFMSSAQRAQLAIQNAQHAASETTKTAVTTTGVATRTGVENTGFFAKLLGLLGISVGAHTGAETAKTTATATGAATRAAAEDTAAATSAATQIASNVTTALSYVGVAGAAGTASWAAAPWPIDAGAPAFGASMAATAAGFAAEASLATGTNELPRDMIVQAHEGERVVPKADNAKLIQMMAMASGGSDGGRSDVHLHYSPTIHERERMGLKQLLASDSGAMIDFLNRQVRDGKLKLQPARA